MAIYVRLINGGSVQTWNGSNLGVPFDDGVAPAATPVEIQAYSAMWGSILPAADVTWELLNAPDGTTKNEPWFIAANGGSLTNVNPLLSAGGPTPDFIPDKEGTWFFRCTRISTSESIDFVVSTLNVKTRMRIPAAGETTEADQDTLNHAYSAGGPDGQGWAKDRNFAMDVIEDLATTGGVQVCYFDDAAGIVPAPWGGTLKAGAAVAISGTRQINATTGEHVPTVVLADGTTNYEYIGIVKSGVDGNTATIANQSLIWVSRSGMVASETGIIDTATVPKLVGEVLYLSPTAGILQRGTDRFALGVASTPRYAVPACVVLNVSTAGKVLALPREYLGGISAVTDDQSFRFVGLGDFRGVRVGSGQAAQVAGESTGAIEMIATNSEAVGITAGQVCMLHYNAAGGRVLAYVADSNSNNTAASVYKKNGIIGVAIEAVAAGVVGHFVIYGPATTNLSVDATTARYKDVYVGSSRTGSANVGRAVLFSEVGGNDQYSDTSSNTDYNAANLIIPVGQLVWDGAALVVLVGFHKQTGFVDSSLGGISAQGLNSGLITTPGVSPLRTVGESFNNSVLSVQDSAVTLTVDNAGTTIKVAGSGADDPIVEVDLYECKLPGTALSSTVPATALAGSRTAAMPWPGADLVRATPLYGTFSYDQRLDYGTNTTVAANNIYDNPTRVKIYGYTKGNNVSILTLKTKLRFNVQALIDGANMLPTTNETPDYPFWTYLLNLPEVSITNTNAGLVTEFKELCFDIPIYDNNTVPSAAGNKVGSTGVPSLSLISPSHSLETTTVVPVSNNFTNKILTVDAVIERTDVSATDFFVTQVVLESDKRSQAPDRHSYYEACWPAYAFLNDAGAFDIVDEGATVNAAPPAGVDVDLRGVENSSVTGSTLNDIVGFIPRDSRAPTPGAALAASYAFLIDGKFSGAAGTASGDTLTLKFYVKEVSAGTTCSNSISAAAPLIVNGTTDSWTPVFTAAAGEVSNTRHTETFDPPSSDAVIGWWFKIERDISGGISSGGASADINGAEVFYLMSNVNLHQLIDNSDSRYSNPNTPEAIYEQHVLGTAMVSTTTGALTRNSYGDVAGALLTGSDPTVVFTTVFDYRYDDKSGVIVDVVVGAENDGGTVKLKLSANYSDCGDIMPAASVDIQTYSVDNSAAVAAGQVRFLKFTFNVPPDIFWSNLNTPTGTYEKPNLSSGSNKGTVRWTVTRTDTQTYDLSVLSATVRSDKSNKTTLGGISPININEDYSSARATGVGQGPLYVPSYPRYDGYRTENLSVQRFSWKFVSPPSWLVAAAGIAGGSSAYLTVPGMEGIDLTARGLTTVSLGQYIPYSFAITDIYGYCGQPTGANVLSPLLGGESGTAQIALDFGILEIPTATGDATATAGTASVQDAIVGTAHNGAAGIPRTIIFPGVQGFPLTVYPDLNGGVRWNATTMSNAAGGTGTVAEYMPKVVLPKDYKALIPANLAGSQWQLVCLVRNVSGSEVLPLINLTVEIALLPQYNADRYGVMGGSVSNTSKKTYGY